jgi:hypothetical protein
MVPLALGNYIIYYARLYMFKSLDINQVIEIECINFQNAIDGLPLMSMKLAASDHFNNFA